MSTAPTRALTARQRTAPPMDRWHNRPDNAAGGYEFADPRTLAPGLETELARYPGAVYDGRVIRDRWPYYQRPRMTEPGDSWVNWTEAGPRRPELHMRNQTWRNMVGNSESRYPFIAGAPTGGRHTMGPPGVARTVDRYVTVPQMTSARPFRLAPGQYANQTYSQTTLPQGVRRR